MSDLKNTELLERAKEMIEAYAGTMIATQLELNIHMNDLETLRVNVASAEAKMAEENFHAEDALSDHE